MATSRMKWMVTVSAIIASMSVCVAIAAVFPNFITAVAVGMVASVVIPPVIVSAVYIVVPPNTARVVRDEMGRVARVLGPGDHTVIPWLERLRECANRSACAGRP